MKKVIIAFFLALCMCTFLGLTSDPPPYGEPFNELSNNFWGFTVDIAHKWRTLDFTLWDQTIGGGSSIFICGQYPLLNPTNALAWVLNDEQFYLFKLIEPYFIGIFFTSLILLDLFAMPTFIAAFGSFMYMGLILARQTPLSQSPIFLFGCAVFPLGIYLFLKFFSRNMYLACALLGVSVALDFLGSGVTQLIQTIIWCALLIIVYIDLERKEKSLTVGLLKDLALGLTIFMGMAIAVCAIQFLPTYLFSFFDSARMPGHYPINNFPIEFRAGLEVNNRCLLGILDQAFVTTDGSISLRGISAVLLVLLAISLAHFYHIKSLFLKSTHLGKIWITMALYLALPYILELITIICPWAMQYLSFFTTFTFVYGVHALDFCLMLTVCELLRTGFVLNPLEDIDRWKYPVIVVLIGVALLLALLPLFSYFFPDIIQIWGPKFPIIYRFVPHNFGSMLINTVATLIIVVCLGRGYSHPVSKFLFAGSLVILGGMLTVGCFHWNNKGNQTNLASYGFDTPEHRYYQQAKGKYYLPITSPPTMLANYSLLYGVHSTSGFIAIPPYRFNKFMATYHTNFSNVNKYWAVYQYRLHHPSCALLEHFPVNFTTITHGQALACPGFKKTVDGRDYDVWEKETEPAQVLFCHRLAFKPLEKLITFFNEPFDGTLWMENDDAHHFKVLGQTFPKDNQPHMSAFKTRPGRVSFRVKTEAATYAINKNMYQRGWHLKIDGVEKKVFPAQFLFLGFEIPAGDHRIELYYVPPGLLWGALINVAAVVGLILWILFYYKKRPQQIKNK